MLITRIFVVVTIVPFSIWAFFAVLIPEIGHAFWCAGDEVGGAWEDARKVWNMTPAQLEAKAKRRDRK